MDVQLWPVVSGIILIQNCVRGMLTLRIIDAYGVF
jgi:hypothetical protein